MKKEITIEECLCATHIGIERQGPGSKEMTLRALSFTAELGGKAKVLDLGCGTGGQTLVLAQYIKGEVIGMDLFPDFIDVLNNNAKKMELQNRVRGVVGDMQKLPFDKEEFDLIWSEGAVDSIGFEEGMDYWQGFLKKGGYAAVTCPTWLTDKRPKEIEKFWCDAVGKLGTIAENVSAMQRAGFEFLAAFVLPEYCWTENYFKPREAAGKELLRKHPKNKVVEEYLQGDKYEAELYLKYKQYYGYVFFVGKKN